MYDSVLAELTKFDRVSKPAGQAALVLARKLDRGTDTVSALASAARTMDALLEKAIAGAKDEGDGVDMLKAKRAEQERRAAAR